MNRSELPPISDFDSLVAPLEVELVCDELGIMEGVIREYPNLKHTFTKSKDKLLSDPTAFFVSNEETRIMTEASSPAIAKLIYGD